MNDPYCSAKRKRADQREERQDDPQDNSLTATVNHSRSKKLKVTKRTVMQQGICTDPLALADLVTDRILEYLDIKSLLQGRRVCQRWNEQIITRKRLWRPICQKQPLQLNGFQSNDKTFFFSLFIASQRILNQMLREKENVFKVVEHSLTSCFLDNTKEHPLGSYFPNYSSELPPSSVTRKTRQDCHRAFDEWLQENEWLSICDPCNRFDMYDRDRVVIVTDEHVLKVVNSKDRQVLWKRENCEILGIFASNDLIFTATHEGAIRAFSLDGNFEHQLEADKNLECIIAMDVHPSGHFMLAGLSTDKVRLVNNRKEVFTIDFEQVNRRKNGRRLLRVSFLSDTVLNEDQLAIGILKVSGLDIAIINQTGKVLHHRSFGTSGVLSFLPSSCLSSSGDMYEFFRFTANTRKIEKRSIYCEPNGIMTRRVWVQNFSLSPAFPVYEYICKVYILAAGKKFFLMAFNWDLFICRQDLGTVIAKFPGFFFESLNHLPVSTSLPRVSLLPSLAVVISDSDDIPEGWVFLANSKWLDGLCPSATELNEPIIVCLDKFSMKRRCLYWSTELWSDLAEKVEYEKVDLQDPPQPPSSGIWNNASLFEQSLVK